MTGRTAPADYFAIAHGSVEVVKRGLAWLVAQADTDPGIVLVSTMSQFTASDLASAVPVACGAWAKGNPAKINNRVIYGATHRTFRTSKWSRGPVLALWPDLEFLEKLHDDHRVSAVCVVPWGLEEIAPWVKAKNANDLTGAQRPSSAVTISDPVVAAAVKSITLVVNLSTGLVHPRDRSSAINAFKILRDRRHRWDPAEIYAWALANGWSGDGAAELRDVADGVQRGKAYRAGPSDWAVDIYARWSTASTP